MAPLSKLVMSLSHRQSVSVFFSDKPIMDPGKLEEVILDGQLIMAMNSHSEICCAKMCGVPVKFDQVFYSKLFSRSEQQLSFITLGRQSAESAKTLWQI